MRDTIYRDEAIKAMRLEYPMMPMFKGLREEWAIKTEGFRKAEEVIMNLPSADRPTGEWNFLGDNMFQCTSCGEVYSTLQFEMMRNRTTDSLFPKGCPHCGEMMKGADDEYDR